MYLFHGVSYAVFTPPYVHLKTLINTHIRNVPMFLRLPKLFLCFRPADVCGITNRLCKPDCSSYANCCVS